MMSDDLVSQPVPLTAIPSFLTDPWEINLNFIFHFPFTKQICLEIENYQKLPPSDYITGEYKSLSFWKKYLASFLFLAVGIIDFFLLTIRSYPRTFSIIHTLYSPICRSLLQLSGDSRWLLISRSRYFSGHPCRFFTSRWDFHFDNKSEKILPSPY